MVSIVDQQRKEGKKKTLVLEEQLCAYCRTPPIPSKEIKRTKKLMEAGNASAFNYLAGLYSTGMHGLPRDMAKACELWLKAGELGCATSYSYLCLGNHYRDGNGVEMDKKKMVHCYELAAMGGYLDARHNLGVLDWEAGIHHQDMDEKRAMYYSDRAVKHFLLAARAGHKGSLNNVKHIFMHGNGEVTKDEYTNTLRAYQESHDEMNSDARVKAAELDHTVDREVFLIIARNEEMVQF